MAGWSPDIQVLKSDVSGLLQLVSYVKFKVKAGSGGVVLGPINIFHRYFVELTILHNLKVLDLLESQKWRAGVQTYKFSNRTYQVSFS